MTMSGPNSSARPAAQVVLAAPRGFCAGVRRAIDTVTDALAEHGPPVYVRRAIVHNLAVVRELERLGAVFVEEIDEVPPGAVIVLSAHGVTPAVAQAARGRGATVYDAMCPLVAKVHREVARHHDAGRHVVLIGHEGHPEIVGTLGQVPDGSATLVRTPADVAALPFEAGAPLAFAVQTTFSVDEAAQVVSALQVRFGNLAAPPASDICYATQNRQAAVRAISERADAVVVVGAAFSSNATRLGEVARERCRAVQLVADGDALDWALLPARGGVIGLTAAASTPEASVRDVVRALRGRYRVTLTEHRSATETRRFGKVKVGGAGQPRAAA
ncbi:MAG TPA: 4-hydroxy-3-methylbut-2-enyl diphosphate reductase [Croceibacterium sp.]